MAQQEETILLHFDIDEQPAVNSIKDLRAANSQLRKERDAVNLSTDEGRKLVEKLNVAIDKNNKTIKDNSSALEKQRQNVGNYTESIKDAAGELNVFGVNLGSATTNMTKFINPATAAAGVLTVLVGLYASSAAGANDLARANSSLTASFDELSNQIGGGGGGRGFAEKAAIRWGQIITAFTSNTKAIRAEREENVAIARVELETLKDLEVDKIKAAANAKRREKEAEDARRVRDDAEKTQKERLDAAALVTEKLTGLETERVNILRMQARALLNYGELTGSITEGTLKEFDATGKVLDKNIQNREVKKAVLTIEQEISDIQENINGKLTENISAVRGIKKEEAERLKALKKTNKEQEEERRKTAREEVLKRGAGGTNLSDIKTETVEVDTAKAVGDILIGFEKNKQDRLNELAKEGAEYRALVAEQEITTAIAFADAAAILTGIAGEQSAAYKVFASASTIISTYSAATKAYEAAFFPVSTVASPALGAAFASVAVAQGLANLAKINEVEFAGGGWTGPGSKYQPAGIVHADEYVTPKHIVNSPAAQPHLAALESMRTRGYADGGFVANTNMEASRQAMMMANLIKGMPAPEVSVVQFRKVEKQVLVKENISRA